MNKITYRAEAYYHPEYREKFIGDFDTEQEMIDYVASCIHAIRDKIKADKAAGIPTEFSEKALEYELKCWKISYIINKASTDTLMEKH